MAWWVVIGHAIHLAGTPEWLNHHISSILTRVDVAVNVFIILSGFVITHLLLTKNEKYPPYITRRFFRIFPVYLFCLLLALLTVESYKFAYIKLPFATQSSMRVERLLETDENFGWHLAAHLTLFHGAIPNTVLPYAGTSILAPAWSLSLEWQFYLIAPLLVGLMSSQIRAFIATCIGSALTYVVARNFLDDYYQYPSFIAIALPFFVLGIISRLILSHFNATTVTTLLFTFLATSLIWQVELLIWLLWCIFIASECGIIHKRGEPSVKLIQRLISSNSVLSALGTWSYSTYLVHIPVFGIFIHLSTGQQLFQLEASRLNVQFILIGAILLLVPISWLMYKYIEKPGIRLGTALAGRF